METFFATHAQSYLESQIFEAAKQDKHKEIASIIGSIKGAIKFRLPPDCSLINNFESKPIDYAVEEYLGGKLMLPFKQVILEAPHSSQQHSSANGKVLLATQLTSEADGREGIAIHSITKYGELKADYWVVTDALGLMYFEGGALEVGIHRISGPKHIFRPPVNGYDRFVSSLALLVVEFLSALACSNSLTVDEPSNRHRLNKKRIKQGKPPFYSYKILKISQDRMNSRQGLGGSHQPPRVHLRRGHIRRLPNKTVWVNAAVVGDKSKGFVAKDYAVAAQA
ncbi:hypothetical protein [uncultured Marinobacter sp.]|uniref:hypothetical protein n=1 Tax=uncultured Marinobacter sp. TaxID=187379 RepID=UPI0030DC9482|tara:strand:+ start:244 stop:1086 length:843 start_codon:yes stop_codon:yes gene_type:complete